jgi:hypothetical protein
MPECYGHNDFFQIQKNVFKIYLKVHVIFIDIDGNVSSEKSQIF